MVDQDLKEVLKNKPGGENLLFEIEVIKKEVAPLLDRILITFPGFTPHNISHSENVLARMQDIISDSLKENLNSYEIYFLIISAYLHDLGMVDLDNLTIPEDLKKDSEKLKKYIRDNHHKRSEEFIIENYEMLKIPI